MSGTETRCAESSIRCTAGIRSAACSFGRRKPRRRHVRPSSTLPGRTGYKPGLSGPVAVLLNQPGEVLALASAAGYRCFTSLPDLRAHIVADILRLEAA